MARKDETAVVVGKTPEKHFSKRAAVLVAGVVLMIAAIVLITSLHKQSAGKTNQARDALVTQAAALINKNASSAKLAPIVSQLKQQPGYDTDADSLYVVTTYYLEISDATNLQTYYSKLTKAYDTKTGYNNPALVYARSPNKLQADVAYIEAQAKQAKDHVYGPAPGQAYR